MQPCCVQPAAYACDADSNQRQLRMSTHHDADAQKLKHCLGRLLAAGEVDGTTDPSAAVQTLIRAHPEYGRRPV